MAKSRKKAGTAASPGEASDIGLPVMPQSAGDTTAASVDQARIAERAYELYLARGGSHGQDMDDWFNAERELTGAGAHRGNNER